MTPERKAWWDSLPKEEKRVRQDIADFKTAIKYSKASLNSSAGYPGFEKCSIRYHKKSIRALRRQIAQYPYRKDTHRVHCPNCWMWIVECYNEPPHCKYCGQKLRWK